jgi:hypothetical protein
VESFSNSRLRAKAPASSPPTRPNPTASPAHRNPLAGLDDTLASWSRHSDREETRASQSRAKIGKIRTGQGWTLRRRTATAQGGSRGTAAAGRSRKRTALWSPELEGCFGWLRSLGRRGVQAILDRFLALFCHPPPEDSDCFKPLGSAAPKGFLRPPAALRQLAARGQHSFVKRQRLGRLDERCAAAVGRLDGLDRGWPN